MKILLLLHSPIPIGVQAFKIHALVFVLSNSIEQMINSQFQGDFLLRNKQTVWVSAKSHIS